MSLKRCEGVPFGDYTSTRGTDVKEGSKEGPVAKRKAHTLGRCIAHTNTHTPLHCLH